MPGYVVGERRCLLADLDAVLLGLEPETLSSAVHEAGKEGYEVDGQDDDYGNADGVGPAEGIWLLGQDKVVSPHGTVQMIDVQ